MRKLIIALALSTTAAASPALARDGSPYVGVDLGGMIAEDQMFDYTVNGLAPSEYKLDHKVGLDAGVYAGYDFGMFRAEAELAYKRASITDITIQPNSTITAGGPFDAAGNSTVISGMVNGMLDFESDRWAGFVGGGLGLADVRTEHSAAVLPVTIRDHDVGFAWQVLGGVRYALSYNLDLGLKYRMLNVPNLKFTRDGGAVRTESRWRSHSLLASLIYNFGSPPVVVVPPPVIVEQAPPPPATQTCPDGSVILATAVCPPPPPPPPGERG